MKKTTRSAWRRYRALSARAQASIALVTVVLTALIVLVAAVSATTRPAPVSTSATTATAPATSAAPAASLATSVTASPPTTTSPPAAAGTGCHVRGTGLFVLPDPACTPGVTNPDVTQSDIGTTICRSGWTATIRPPESYTEPLKIQQMAAYGEPGPLGSYEEDHLISLELGGSPRDPRNLWPEPGGSPNPKDSVENAARRAVCDGHMSLATAQHDIATDWIALGQQLGAGRRP